MGACSCDGCISIDDDELNQSFYVCIDKDELKTEVNF